MIQKFLFTIFIIFIFLFGIRFLKRFSFSPSKNNKNNKKEEEIVDLEKDPKTNEYRPKQ